jgi:hypothetical protein
MIISDEDERRVKIFFFSFSIYILGLELLTRVPLTLFGSFTVKVSLCYKKQARSNAVDKKVLPTRQTADARTFFYLGHHSIWSIDYDIVYLITNLWN